MNNLSPKTFKTEIAGKTYEVETGKLAQQANGSCTVRVGDTVILGTATAKREAGDMDFLPLSIAYQEKMYASGKISSNKFIKRETRPSESKILSARVLDRGFRPLLNKDWRFETQLMLTILAYDGVNYHDTIAGLAGSISLAISDIPFIENVLVRVGMDEKGEFILNPTVEEMANSDLDLLVTCTKENIVMIEAGANIVTEKKLIEAMEFGLENSKKLIEFIEKIKAEVGKEKRIYEVSTPDERIKSLIEEKYYDQIEEIIFKDISKGDRFAAIGDLSKEAQKIICEELNSEDEIICTEKEVAEIFSKVQKGIIRYNILKKERRIKGRGLDEIRPLNCEVDILPRVHGVGLFNRGETQGLSVVTLGGPGDVQMVTGVEGDSTKHYFHHYNFPPYSVGEVSNRLMTGNREIGHGALAERALRPVLPSIEDFPYTIRVVSEILSSNGSSSMAATCGSTLALMDAGVPIKEPVSGIAMGLMTDYETGEYKILTDLQDEEDFGGDMDFKVTGTKDGITCIQMDIKLTGIPMEIFKIAFEKARVGRLKVMDAMLSAIPTVRKQLKDTAPSLISFKIDENDIKIVIGKLGETINKIIAEYKCEINISDEGNVVITAENQAMGNAAKAYIENLLEKPEPGKIYEGKVVKVMEFGVFVSFMPGIDGLVHISQISDKRIESQSEMPQEGDIVKVKLLEIDSQGRNKLSIKDAK